jgi:hypothetical protein
MMSSFTGTYVGYWRNVFYNGWFADHSRNASTKPELTSLNCIERTFIKMKTRKKLANPEIQNWLGNSCLCVSVRHTWSYNFISLEKILIWQLVKQSPREINQPLSFHKRRLGLRCREIRSVASHNKLWRCFWKKWSIYLISLHLFVQQTLNCMHKQLITNGANKGRLKK